MDYSAPITPGEALRYVAGRHDKEGLRYDVAQLRREAAVLLAKADLLEESAVRIEGEARRFDQYQPTITPCDDPGAHA